LTPRPERLRIREFTTFVIRRQAIIGIVAALIFAGAGVFDLLCPSVYQATAILGVVTDTAATKPTGENGLARAKNPRLESVEAHIEILLSRPLLQKALQRLSPADQALINQYSSELGDSVDISAIAKTNMLSVSAYSFKPGSAVALSDAVCQEYIEEKRDQRRKELSSVLEDLRNRMVVIIHSLYGYRAQSLPVIHSPQLTNRAKAGSSHLEPRSYSPATHYGMEKPPPQPTSQPATRSALKLPTAIKPMPEATLREYGIAEYAPPKPLSETDHQSFRDIDPEDLKRTYRKLYDIYQDLSLSAIVEDDSSYVAVPAQLRDELYSPHRGRNLVLAIITGLWAGIGLAFVLDLLDGHVHSDQEVVSISGLPVLMCVPELRKGQWLQVTEKPLDSPLQGNFAALYGHLMTLAEDAPLRSILITSGQPREGKSLCAAYLAAAMAEEGTRVILVSGNSESPFMRKFFGLPDRCTAGDRNVQTGVQKADLTTDPGQTTAHKLVTTSLSNVRVLPQGATYTYTQTPSEIKKLLEEADCVIFDAPSMSMGAQAQVLSRWVDAVVWVVSCQGASQETIQHTRTLFAQVEARVLGVVLNQVTKGIGGYERCHVSTYQRHATAGTPP